MTPDELAELKEDLASFTDEERHGVDMAMNVVYRLLDHIDAQAEELALLTSTTVKLSDRYVDLERQAERTRAALLELIDAVLAVRPVSYDQQASLRLQAAVAAAKSFFTTPE